MAIIYTYGYDSNISGADALVGTDSTGRKTKQFKISDLTNYISENAGVIAGVNSITTTDSTFISLTPDIPEDGDVTITSTLSATGTPDETTYLRGDNTWATIPSGEDNYVDNISFNTGTGELTLGRTGVLPDLVQSLDGRYALSGSGITGSGTTNYVAKWNTTSALNDSIIYDDGSAVGIGTTSPGNRTLRVVGAIGASRVYFRNASTDPSFYIEYASGDRLKYVAFNNHRFITGSNTVVTTMQQNGQLTLHKYGVGTFQSTPVYNLGVDSTGNVVETAGGVPTSVTATPGGSLNLASNIDFVYFTWSGGSGTFNLNLPSASTNAYRIIRFVCDSTVNANDKIHVQGSGGDTVDGGLFYTLNKPYNGVQVWSDGSEWIVIQAKAT